MCYCYPPLLPPLVRPGLRAQLGMKQTDRLQRSCDFSCCTEREMGRLGCGGCSFFKAKTKRLKAAPGSPSLTLLPPLSPKKSASSCFCYVPLALAAVPVLALCRLLGRWGQPAAIPTLSPLEDQAFPLRLSSLLESLYAALLQSPRQGWALRSDSQWISAPLAI